ncbi:molybdopterin molybdenumtransferase MoeA [Glaciihabitans arcticus]|uniref:Molybdopterin molybdenumtransferase n=1 Tax=Glaciihabitans arcticus TaxID=2668039 RepID=A0A4Q9GZS1_9MICO|nr:gephyrin-like molybdotransferase Glp [Glaciihabitans arcticus]TBN57910.1 molybdopterin molybdenumtransferase MoeA [Glaciihabitans arcticus]
MHRIPVDEYVAIVANHLRDALAPRTETVALGKALGRVTVAQVLSPVDLPLFRNSQMDGFAVRARDVASPPVTLPIAGIIAAGAAEPTSLPAGAAMQIMTGAVIPEGSDAVVPVEDTTSTGATVTVLKSRAQGEFVREAGSDARIGDTLLPAGLTLAPRHLAVLAAAGIASVDVRALPRIAVVTTGAELIAPGVEPLLGQLFDANGVALAALVESSGAVVSALVRNDDDVVASLDLALREAAVDTDLILTSGGISMGEFEVVRELLEPLGATVGTIAMQPGGPQLLGAFHGIPVIGFPGNPVSTQISFEVLVAPLLRAAAGRAPAEKRHHTVETAIDSVPGKRQFLRGRITDGNAVSIVSGPGSHLVAGLAASDVLIDIPAETTRVEAGDTVETWTL